jgi:N6-L-threonylcarbamoyladenine synthase
MLMLGIETSCDETSAAVVAEADGRWSIGSNIVASQAAIHREWGGVVPELASRQHIRDICGTVRAALDAAGVGLADIDAIAVTQGPGLVGSLLVGVSFAKSLSVSLDRPLVPVHHLAGHIESLFLEHAGNELPLAAHVV